MHVRFADPLVTVDILQHVELHTSDPEHDEFLHQNWIVRLLGPLPTRLEGARKGSGHRKRVLFRILGGLNRNYEIPWVDLKGRNRPFQELVKADLRRRVLDLATFANPDSSRASWSRLHGTYITCEDFRYVKNTKNRDLVKTRRLVIEDGQSRQEGNPQNVVDRWHGRLWYLSLIPSFYSSTSENVC